MRRLQENQLRGTQRGGVLHVQEIPSLNLHTKTSYRIQIFPAVCSSSSEIVSTDYAIFFPVLRLGYVRGHYTTWKQLTEQVMERYRMFPVPIHRPWQHYRIGRIHPPARPLTAAVFRTAIKETQCLLYRLSDVTGCKQIASSQENVASGERTTVVSKICSPT
jgi:hypothetical protein